MRNSPLWLLNESLSQLDHNRLIALINSLQEGFLAIDGNGKIELSNGRALSLLDDHSLKGKLLEDSMVLIDSAGQKVNLMALIERKGDSLPSTGFHIKHADGDLIPVFVSVAPVRGYKNKSEGGYVILLNEAN